MNLLEFSGTHCLQLPMRLKARTSGGKPLPDLELIKVVLCFFS